MLTTLVSVVSALAGSTLLGHEARLVDVVGLFAGGFGAGAGFTAALVTGLMPYVPARDFELSKRFYSALGFVMSEGWGGTADFALDGHAFRLQNFYVKDWVENFMFVIGVTDLEAWNERAAELLESNEFPGMRLKPPEQVDGSTVLHVFDPTGVLLVFVQ